jgi:hypothetical protein
MSLAETQQIMAMLQEIMRMLDNVDVKTSKLEADLPKTKEALATKRDLLRLMTELNQVLAFLGASELNDYISKLQKAIFFTNALMIAAKMFERGTLIGNILGVAAVAGTMISASNLEGH